jgi:CRISPR-associated protein Csd1
MILQALYAYYQRRMRHPDPTRRLPPFGFEDKAIPFIIEIDRLGGLIAIKDTRVMEGKTKISRSYLVPKGVKKTSGVAANLLWDTAAYVLGTDNKGKAERTAEQRQAFMARVEALVVLAPDDAGLLAVHRFLSELSVDSLAKEPAWPEILETNPNLSFRLRGDDELVCQRPMVVAALMQQTAVHAENGQPLSMCLVTGESAPHELLHTAIKGVWGAHSAGANIVSFNLDAFRSFGKDQGGNAPVGEPAAFAYTTALNHLLAKGSRQRMQVGDASAVFWAEADGDTDIEDAFAALFSETDDPDARAEQVRALFEAIRSGRFDGARGLQRFFVLGLAPNAARIAIRFWHAAPLSEIGKRIRLWFDDLRLKPGPKDPEYPSLFRLLTAVSVQGKADNIPPKLGGDIMRSILAGGTFPVTWLNAAVQRNRAEQDVTYLRAATIKACLNRAGRLSPTANQHGLLKEEFSAMLDLNNAGTPYRLGRLFSTLEKIQEEASPGLNATIRDRYFGAASSTPVAVFTTLLRLKNHHLGKLANRGRVTNFEKLIGEIMSEIHDFPVHLALQDQGRFALGYYHQRQAFFTKSDHIETTPQDQEITQ